ncbi:hypothetical protein [Salicibibacter kimchii]|uniref:hypothetical protein n=1 Tax=Salicibibacter kimchii TaxID=2099786 RepID=UPI0013576AB5|nr:hypothetical protein [Salicibibacter kimchii]
MSGQFIFTQEELEQKLVYWQKILKLQDWDISIEKKKMIGEDFEGNVQCFLESKEAFISILDEDYRPDDSLGEHDMEETLVHELLHLHLYPISEIAEDKPNYDLFEEQAINALAKAYVYLDRRGGE